MTPGLVIQGEASLCPWQQLLRADGRSWELARSGQDTQK